MNLVGLDANVIFIFTIPTGPLACIGISVVLSLMSYPHGSMFPLLFVFHYLFSRRSAPDLRSANAY